MFDEMVKRKLTNPDTQEEFDKGVRMYANFEPRPVIDHENPHHPSGTLWLGWMIGRSRDLTHIWKMHKLAGIDSENPICEAAIKALDASHGLERPTDEKETKDAG